MTIPEPEGAAINLEASTIRYTVSAFVQEQAHTGSWFYKSEVGTGEQIDSSGTNRANKKRIGRGWLVDRMLHSDATGPLWAWLRAAYGLGSGSVQSVRFPTGERSIRRPWLVPLPMASIKEKQQ
jgi:hypothetical protein